MSTYDLREAKELLGHAVAKLGDKNKEKLQAHRALLEDLLLLSGTADVLIERERTDEDVALISLGRRHAFIMWEPAIGHRVMGGTTVGGAGNEIIVKLEFNSATMRFEGTPDDPYTVPTPGAPRARRSPIAILIEAVCKLWSN